MRLHEPVEESKTVGWPLLEREAELASLRRLAARAVRGEGGLAVIEGPPGIGKSRVLREAAAVARDTGMQTLDCRGTELERQLPFGLVRQLFETRIARLEPGARDELLSGAARLAGPIVCATGGYDVPAGPEPASSVLHGLYWLTANLADLGPLAIAVDDAHWADAPSLRYLTFLANRVQGLAVLLVVTRRPSEPGAEIELLDEIGSVPLAHAIRLGALAPPSVSELVRAALGREPEPSFAAACHEATRGNPLLLRELLADLAQAECEPVSRNAERVLTLAPGGVARSVLRRVRRLGPEAVSLASSAAVLGTRADAPTAARLAGLDPAPASDAADALARIDVLVPGTLEFVHPIVRTAIYAELPSREAARLHGIAARLLAERGRDGDEVAAQLLAAEPAGDPWTVDVLHGMARRARARGAPEVAARYLHRALAEGTAEPPRAELLRDLGGAEVATAKPHGADRLRQAYELTADPRQRAQVGLETARALTLHGDLAEAADVLERSLADLDGPDPELSGRLEAELIAVSISDLALRHRADAHVMSLFEEGETIRDPLRLATLAIVMASVIEPAATGADLAERAVRHPPLSPEEDQLLYLHAANALVSANRFERARRLWDQAVDRARHAGSVTAFGFASTLRAGISVRTGALGEAEADLRVPLETIGGDPRLPFTFVAAPLTHVLIERGELEAADRLHADVGPGTDLPERIDQNFALESIARLRLAQGRTEEGVALLRELGRRLEAFGIRNPAAVAWRSLIGPALARVGDRDEARELVAEEVQLARGFDVPRELGVALRAQALVEPEDAAVDLLREAVSILETTPARLEHARAVTELGATLVHLGHRSDAREPLRLGLDVARRCGASVLAERAHSELVASGARPRRLVFSGVDSLTASERRVADMAAGGRTNREIAQALFVTEKTVEGHLLHAYRKLEIGSRSELPRALRRPAGE